MGLFDKLRNEFIDIIEWTDNTGDTMIWKFPRYQNEIKNGAQLTVRESQLAVLVDEGKIADVFHPGRYELSTANIPLLSTIRGWKYGFNSPFKVDVYFINTKEFLNQRWGTANPIMMRDPEFGPIRIRAFGNYCFKINAEDPKKFLLTVVGTNAQFSTENVSDQLRNFVITKFSDHVAESKIAALDMAGNLNEYSESLAQSLSADFEYYGLKLTKFLVENISLPEEVEKALDQRTSMGILGSGNVGQLNMNPYVQMQMGKSLEASAENPGGGGAGANAMGMGLGFGMAQQMTQQMNQMQQHPMQQQPQGATVAPPPIPQAPSYFVAVNGQQQGPFSAAQLQQMAQQGQFSPNSLVWTQGMAGWVAASTVQALANVFAQTPPPVPPAL